MPRFLTEFPHSDWYTARINQLWSGKGFGTERVPLIRNSQQCRTRPISPAKQYKEAYLRRVGEKVAREKHGEVRGDKLQDWANVWSTLCACTWNRDRRTRTLMYVVPVVLSDRQPVLAPRPAPALLPAHPQCATKQFHPVDSRTIFDFYRNGQELSTALATLTSSRSS